MRFRNNTPNEWFIIIKSATHFMHIRTFDVMWNGRKFETVNWY